MKKDIPAKKAIVLGLAALAATGASYAGIAVVTPLGSAFGATLGQLFSTGLPLREFALLAVGAVGLVAGISIIRRNRRS